MSKKNYYPVVDSNPSLPKIEEKILQKWAQNGTFKKSVENAGKAGDFVFYDGPPFANGLPHYGHLLTGYVKDIFPRYQTMLGKKVERRFGWDCHGLPAEMGAEKELGISGRAAIMNYGIDKFNDRCRSDVMKYASEWEKYVNRQARWVDFKNDYKTMDKSFMESVMWAFKQLYDKGLVYEAMRVMPYSWAAETPLSNFETKLDNSYRERADKAVTVAFELSEESTKEFFSRLNKSAEKSADLDLNLIKTVKILAWTTTPWTLPSNLALAAHKEFTYEADIVGDTAFIALEQGIEKYTGALKEGETRPFANFAGELLLGLTYNPLFPYFANQPNAFKIISGDFIEEGSGTGVVHIAPGFGEDDFRVGQENNIGIVVPVDNSGKFTAEVSDYQGINIFDANELIIKRLKDEGKLIKQEQILHNYPHCWRTDQPLIYKALPSWYVEVTKFKDRMVELNKSVNWIPENVRDGLFGKWLEGARDWSISRNRFWGAPIPIWRSPTGKLKCVGSIAELEALSGKKVNDLHRPYIDEVKFTIDGEEYTRVEDVLDCWFESGSMPYASQGLTGEKPKPADFIVEYTAQTRGWFYTMTVLGVALFDEIPFKNVICHGVVLGEPAKDPNTGKMVQQKLSKRLKNYPEPMLVFDEYGSDALRWFMLSSPIMRGAELQIDKDGKFIRDIVRLYIKPIWNAYNFFTLYANADGIKAEFNTTSENLMDKYILAKCAESVAAIKNGLDNFDTPSAYAAVEQFFEVLNNWYIRRSKERFWSSEHTPDKQAAYNTLYSVLHIMCRAAAPLLPLILEEIYTSLTGEESVHLTEFPDLSSSTFEDDYLIRSMDFIRKVCNAALSIRSAKNIRVRQPIAKLTVYAEYIPLLGEDEYFRQLILDETNIKSFEFSKDLDFAANKVLAVNAKIVGKRLGEKTKQVIAASKKGDWKIIDYYNDGAVANLPKTASVGGEQLVNTYGAPIGQDFSDEFEIKLEPKSKENSAPLSSNDALVVLDLNLTPELISEGLARDVVRMVQQARKDANLNITDRIALAIETTANIVDFTDYIKDQTLATSLKIGSAQGTHLFENDLDGEKIKIALSVA